MEAISKQPMTAKLLFSQANVKGKFEELLGKRASAFMTSVLQIVSSNDLLSQAEPNSIYHAAAVAATLDLPLNNSLGFAYIVPFRDNKKNLVLAQFQIGYKGFIQLAQRSGQFQTISATPICEGELVESNPLSGFKFDFTKRTSDRVIGYAAYFKLLNGFEKTLFMSADDLKKHGVKYSQTFKKGFGLWKDDFDAMATKTVLKLLLSKFAPLSIDMQKAVITDQGIINDSDATEIEYVDNTEVAINKEEERLQLMIADCSTVDELIKLKTNIEQFESLSDAYEIRFAELSEKVM